MRDAGEQGKPETEPECPSEEGRRPVRMCVRCCAVTDAPVVVVEVHGNSGPGSSVYACPACAAHYPPVQDPLVLLSRRGRTGDER